MWPACNYRDCFEAVENIDDQYCKKHMNLNRKQKIEKAPSDPKFTKKTLTRTQIKARRKVGRR